MGLMDRRAALEAEMDAIIGGPGITGGLVDAEVSAQNPDLSLPRLVRSDIDIPAVLAQRRKLAKLRNDHKDITNKIEKNLDLWDEIVKFGNVEAGDRLQERLVSEALSNEDCQTALAESAITFNIEGNLINTALATSTVI
ncbi:hypothetical protein ABZP36_033943 [Zizania latifolia]